PGGRGGALDVVVGLVAQIGRAQGGVAGRSRRGGQAGWGGRQRRSGGLRGRAGSGGVPRVPRRVVGAHAEVVGRRGGEGRARGGRHVRAGRADLREGTSGRGGALDVVVGLVAHVRPAQVDLAGRG